MSTKRKKNSRNPQGIKVTFIKIHDKSPWDEDYYMCGMCGHAISEKTAAKHAREVHKAGRIQLIEVTDTEIRSPADNTTGKSIAQWCDLCTHHMSYHRLEVPHVCSVEDCSCPGYDSMEERSQLLGISSLLRAGGGLPNILGMVGELPRTSKVLEEELFEPGPSLPVSAGNDGDAGAQVLPEVREEAPEA